MEEIDPRARLIALLDAYDGPGSRTIDGSVNRLDGPLGADVLRVGRGVMFAPRAPLDGYGGR